jgi:hypothetical protein
MGGEGKVVRKDFFFKKKKQKTFGPGLSLSG